MIKYQCPFNVAVLANPCYYHLLLDRLYFSVRISGCKYQIAIFACFDATRIQIFHIIYRMIGVEE